MAKRKRATMKRAAQTHSEVVRLAIEQDIFTGRLPPGAPLDEVAVAERFAVSRTPVREAMLQLVQSGLIEKSPRQGARVAKIDIRRMIQMFEVMSELEGICGKFAARRMSSVERSKLADLHSEAKQALERDDAEKYYTLSRSFHLTIIAGTHNEVLITMTNKLGTQLVPYRRFQLRYPARPEANFQDHGEILDAITERDSERTCQALRKHTTVQGDVLADYISFSGDTDADVQTALMSIPGKP